ncbi:FtsK/SpoIIIE domain-containing protein [Streptomyces sp. NPDC006339]|uniref:FtsK/SpoIIIE domain-containing protein n=1 Tax=Streptomyces sp. NPDC006339 TaxID=3156755 RepID=UPI0033B444E5
MTLPNIPQPGTGPVVFEEGAGSGKSPVLGQLIAQARAAGKRLTVIDAKQTEKRTPVAVPYIPDPHNKQLLPLGVDPSNSRPITLDLDLYPHLLIAGGTGSGVSSTLRLITAHTVATGGTVDVIDPRRVGLAEFEGVPGVSITTDPAGFAAQIEAFHAEMKRRYEQSAKGPRRILAVDDLATSLMAARSFASSAVLKRAVQLLGKVAFAGRAAGMHLALSGVDRGTLRRMGDAALQDAVTVLLLGRTTRMTAQHLGVDPQLRRTYPGAAVLKTPGTTGRQIALSFLTPEQARIVANRPPIAD